MPRESFVIQETDTEQDADGNEVTLETTHDKEVTEISIVRGEKYQEIIGWIY